MTTFVAVTSAMFFIRAGVFLAESPTAGGGKAGAAAIAAAMGIWGLVVLLGGA